MMPGGSGNAVMRIEDLWVRDLAGRVLVGPVNLTVQPGQTVGLAGESGSGKTLTVRAALGLAPRGLTVDAAALNIAGIDVYEASPAKRRRMLGVHVGYIPQNTVAYLHPSLRIGAQMTDGYRTWHPQCTCRDAAERAMGLLSSVGLEDPRRIMASYPAELSGGMRQRVNIAMALMGNPELLVADEPTAALDSLAQVQVIDLLGRVASERRAALLIISHDLALIQRRCDFMGVMYAGRCVEWGPARDVAAHAGHPYTQGLLAAQPRIGMGREGRLCDIAGAMPEDGRDAATCLFAPRCSHAAPECRNGMPPWVECPHGSSTHRCACQWPQWTHDGKACR